MFNFKLNFIFVLFFVTILFSNCTDEKDTVIETTVVEDKENIDNLFNDVITEAQALKNVNKVHANGKTADIERALAVVSLDWINKNLKESRHIILLTDGKITSGRTKADNLASKERVLNYQLGRLKAAGVSVHVVAFSEDADVEFLDTIASETVGWFDVAKTAEQLERTLLRVSKRLVEKNRIPLVANKFTIDETIRQIER